eukprot:TRINITY_DN30259_c0_g1_i1.p1 TRINITY_DN30259_c0_g1~~TRINITY_DN30259_c0_g1_i1.p1  ORF type:complete len:439 (+),score=92.27 TRINITY_DN30259_c0_g1_i1:53-1318(+)
MSTAVRALDTLISKVPSVERDVTYRDCLMAINSVNGSLVPKYEGELLLRGTIPTTHLGQQYHTPVQMRLAGYPRRTPVVCVMPSENMQPYTKARGYQMQRDGSVLTDYMAQWNHGHNLTGLLQDIRVRFDKEPPLYATNARAQTRQRPPVHLDSSTRNRLIAFLEKDIFPKGESYPRSQLNRVTDDIGEAIQTFPTLIPKEEMVGRTVVVKLVGTVPTRFEGNSYNIPVVVRVPQKYPSMQGGIPEIYVNPTPDMQIKQNHRNVDRNGLVYCQYLSGWEETKYLKELVMKVIEVFEGEPPVYAVARPRPAQPAHGAYYAQPQQHAQHAQPAQRPAQAKPKPAMSQSFADKLKGELKVNPAGDDDDKACIVCYENVKDCLLLPCKHMCVCASCVKDLMLRDEKKACPMCREPVADVVLNVFA